MTIGALLFCWENPSVTRLKEGRDVITLMRIKEEQTKDVYCVGIFFNMSQKDTKQSHSFNTTN